VANLPSQAIYHIAVRGRLRICGKSTVTGYDILNIICTEFPESDISVERTFERVWGNVHRTSSGSYFQNLICIKFWKFSALLYSIHQIMDRLHFRERVGQCTATGFVF
jgi:hypothetical protein